MMRNKGEWVEHRDVMRERWGTVEGSYQDDVAESAGCIVGCC